ncbi:MAG: 3-deoxy-8-phosphooctulonate synthase [Bacteriovoracaceae bacterium]|nr:3-deoxy-8-phosphooctulonate synthase [Bacteriovoracaceae bacterium]
MKKIDLFIGPCVLESEALAFTVADYLKKNLKNLEAKLNIYFKGSFDKANRSSPKSYRGPGIEEGLRILEKVKKEFGFGLITDFHLPDQAMAVAGVVDVLQVPAFLCRQSDMIFAGAKACVQYDRILKIKKGQFLSPYEVGNIVEKAAHFLPKEKILITERGFSFGYNNLVVDMASFGIIQSFGVKAIYDATHSVQKPGGLGHATGGKKEQIFPLARAAIAAGADGLFMEVHPEPEKSLSDAATILDMKEAPKILESLVRIRESLYEKNI